MIYLLYRQNKLNEQQSTKKFMDKISGHFKSFDEKVTQLQSDIAEMRMMQSPPPLQPPNTHHEGLLPQNIAGPMSEWMLCQRKKDNVIIFGLPELINGSTCLSGKSLGSQSWLKKNGQSSE